MSNFWRTFGFHTVSAIDTILDRESFTLEDLLDEEEIVQETKTQNKKLLEFLTQPESMSQILEYLTKEPEDEEDQKRKFKYPYVACEILCSEVMAICDAVYQRESFLDAIYSFLDKDSPSNSLLAGYTSRVAGVLLQRKVAETIAYLKKKGNIIEKFIKHLGNSSVMDLLLKIISCEETPEGQSSQILQWLCVQNLIPALVEKFDPSYDMDVHENAAQALVDIIAVSNNVDQTMQTHSPLIAQLESKEIIEKLFAHILSGNSTSALQHGLTVVIELLKRNTNINGGHQDSGELPVLFSVVLENLNNFVNILTTNKPEHAVLTTVGEIVPLGFHRLKVVEFLMSLVKSNHQRVDEELIKLNILSTCLDIFFNYKWNNFLHSIIEQMLVTILEGENEELKFSLFSHTKLADRIVAAWKENEEEIQKPKGMRRGYMGHLMIIIANTLNTAANNPLVKQNLDENQAWNEFIATAYEEAKELEKMQIGGPRPYSLGDPGEEDDEDEKGNSELVNVFTQYLVQQGFASDFAEEFNNDEDDDGEISFGGKSQFDGSFSTSDKKNYMEYEEEDEDSDSEEDTDEEYEYSDEEEPDHREEMNTESEVTQVEGRETPAEATEAEVQPIEATPAVTEGSQNAETQSAST